MLRLRFLPCVSVLLILVPALVVPAQSSLAPPDIARQLSGLADQPPMHTGFVFDRSMLQAARVLLQSGGMDANRAAAALSSISYDNYRYAQTAVYSPDTLAAIAASYHTAGWKHLVDAHRNAANRNGGPGNGQITDLWLHVTGADIDGITVLTRGVRDVNMIQIACELRPLDLVHLGGHFGIPKVDPNAVMVPAPDEH